MEAEDSLSMVDEHLSTIPEKESDKVINFSVENLVPILSESKDLTDYESECDMPVCDDSSSKNEGLDYIVSIPPRKEIDHLDAIPDSVKSLLNRAKSIIFIIEEFVGELAPIDPIPPDDVYFDIEPDTGVLTTKVVDDISDKSTRDIRFMCTRLSVCGMIQKHTWQAKIAGSSCYELSGRVFLANN
ncbi:hypothetical protein Tco_1019232 [Tanacetum coccineum]|uniref:Uncharacterized protein n=1 Tax=Tanacetum coccineum TaxID=301880 RepID=A0ABQ5FYF7_9ASTR